MRCTKCGTESSGAKKFCAECGAPLSNRCPKCAVDNKPTSKFCEECGAALGGRAEPPTTSSHQAAPTAPTIRVTPEQQDPSTTLDGERKTVTALFADIKGSTELMEDIDPEDARAIIDPALRIMVEAVSRYEGYVVQSTGDGIFALFGAPAAYEDHPQRALYAALQMQQELREYGQHLAAKGSHPLEARVGVNTGEVVVRSVETGGKVEYTPIGHTANLASRLQSMAPSGSIAVSEHTRKLCEGYFELRALGPMAARGISEAINVYEVTGLGTLRTHFQLSTRRGLTKFVGRERELEQMQYALEQAIGGNGQIVAVMAEAGTGKSRLFHEFKATIPKPCKVLEAYSVSHGKASAWLPVLELLRKYFSIRDTDAAASRREKVRGTVAALDAALQDTLPYLFGLLGIVEGPDSLAQMDPQVKRQRTLDAIRRIVLNESLKQPVVVIFEDLHWIDAQTQALLDMLADSIANAHVLLLVNYRPEYRHEWTNKSYYSQLRLDPLGAADGAAMLTALLGENVELNPLKRLITERTGGNPFFIEEILQALFDEGALVRNGVVKLTSSLSQLRLPPTVQGILASRIDRQPGEHKQLLQTLAVIGRESSLTLLRQVAAHPNDQLERMLGELRAAEFIYEQPVTGGVEYVFKHALTQEVAYNLLLIERRKLLHERAGQALESIFASQLEDHLTQLAHHYSHSDNFDKAVEYLGRAGQQALLRSANLDAILSLTAAIDLLKKLPDSLERSRRELSLQLTLGPALIPVKGWAVPEVEHAFVRAREICDQLDEPQALFGALFGMWAVYYLRAEFQTAYKIAEQLLERAQGALDSELTMSARNALGDTLFSMGHLLRAQEQLEETISLYDPERNMLLSLVDVGVSALSFAAMTRWNLGYPDQALKRSNEALALANTLSHPHSLVFAQGYRCGLLHCRREIRATQETAEIVIALSREHGFTDFLAAAACHYGWVLGQEGRMEEGISQIQECLARARATGMELARTFYLCTLAETLIDADRFDDASSALTEALSAANEHEERDYEPEIHRLKGELLLRQNDSNTAEAKSCFERAIGIAHKRSAKSWELRATMSFARLLTKQGYPDEARTMLADIYNWFTEGFDTADLKDAKALLDQLGA